MSPSASPDPDPLPSPHAPQAPQAPGPIRWWPAVVIALLFIVAVAWIRSQDHRPFQERNLQTFVAALSAAGLLLVWWLAFSRAPGRARWRAVALALLGIGVVAATVRIRGVDGDLVPILEPRWARHAPAAAPTASATNAAVAAAVSSSRPDAAAYPDFPQFLGPTRNAVLTQPALETDWGRQPPRVRWKQPVGAGWSGFVIVGHRAVTQEQDGESELVTCYDVESGRLLWKHADTARYQTTIAGEGPRATPTVDGDRVYALGATGLLNCLQLADGRPLWQRSIATDAGSNMPDWGFTSSPLVWNGQVLVSAGGKPDRSLLAYRTTDGTIAWTRGGASASYSSPFPVTLAGQPQILMFNARRITAHAPADGTVLWEYPWGVGQPHVAMPIVVSSNRVIFTSGYGVGAELLEIGPGPTNGLAARRVWKSNRMKAKFSNPVLLHGDLVGLDDGVLACVNIADGSLRWKEGRYGHGQGLRVGDLYLLMSEEGALILLRPDATGPNEIGRLPVFTDKTWNPIALAGPFLLVRNDREAACLELPLRPR